MILEHVNPYVNVFVCAADCFTANLVEEVHICITTNCYNVPTINKVVMIILGKSGEVGNRDALYNSDMEVVYSR